MSRYFLRIWVNREYDLQRRLGHGRLLNHTTLLIRPSRGRESDIDRGDYVYIIYYKDRKLLLVGRMKVDRVGNQRMAAKYLGKKPADLYAGAEHAVARKHDATVADFYRTIPPELVKRLIPRRGKKWARLIYKKDGRLEQAQFQAIRELASDSARMLNDLIDKGCSRSDIGAHRLSNAVERALSQARGQGFAGTAEARRALAAHAMNRAKRYFRQRGYAVEDVSASKPYDLRCRKGSHELHVEVKGTTTVGDFVVLTRGEVEWKAPGGTRALYILHSIALDGSKASGGQERIVTSWRIDRKDLTPVAYVYRVAAQHP
jgi:hypothetical protein